MFTIVEFALKVLLNSIETLKNMRFSLGTITSMFFRHNDGMSHKLCLFVLLICLSGQIWANSNLQEKDDELWVKQTLQRMNLDEKIGQLIMPAAVARTPSSQTLKEIQFNIKHFKVGAYHFILDNNSLHSSDEVAELINALQKQSQIPLLIAADFEGGAGFYFHDATRFPRAMAIGATANLNHAYEIGRIVAQESRKMGVHINFYPSADVNSNPQNPIINIRAFGETPELVSKMALAYVRGLQSEGLIATAKHFPGHGNVTCDSHLSLPVVDSSLTELQKIELIPFKALIEGGVRAIMSAHISLPQIDPNLPATLSKSLLTGLLREQMSFDGLIFTDAMMMHSITNNFTNEEAAVLALQAGADVILFPPSVQQAHQAIKKAIQSGRLPEDRIDQSVIRILREKARLKLHKRQFVAEKIHSTSQHAQFADQVMEEALLLKGKNGKTIPTIDSNAQVLLINVLDKNSGWREGQPGKVLFDKMREKLGANINTIELTNLSQEADFQVAANMARKANFVIVATHVGVSAFKGSISLTEGELNFIERLSLEKPSLLFVMFGNPYLVNLFPDLENVIVAFECYPGAERAVAKLLTGSV